MRIQCQVTTFFFILLLNLPQGVYVKSYVPSCCTIVYIHITGNRMEMVMKEEGKKDKDTIWKSQMTISMSRI